MKLTGNMLKVFRKVISTHGSLRSVASHLRISPASMCRYLNGEAESISISNATWKRLMASIGKAFNKAYFGDMLEAAINFSEISVDDFAKKVGVRPIDIHAFIRGEAIPNKEQYEIIIKILGRKLPEFDEIAEINGCLAPKINMNVSLPYLRSIRESIGLKQMELAAYSGVPQRAISGYETSSRKPVCKYAAALASAMCVSVSELSEGLKPGSIPMKVESHKMNGINEWRMTPVNCLDHDIQEALGMMLTSPSEVRSYMLSAIREIRRDFELRMRG